MTWLLWVSFKRNWFKYWLAIVGLAAAVAVSSIGISGAALMWQMSKYPILHVVGGELMVLDARVQFTGSSGSVRSGNLFDTMSYSEVSNSIRETLPDALTTGTLVAVAMHEVGSRVVVAPIYGREDNTGKWMYSVTTMEGENLNADNEGSTVLVVPGTRTGVALGYTHQAQIPTYGQTKLGAWDLAGGIKVPFTVIGTFKQPSHGNPMTSLKTLQSLTGARDRVSFVGVVLANPLMIEQDKQSLQQELTKSHPELQVLSVDDLGALMIADFAKLEQTAAYYTPVMILVSVLIVVVTALAMRRARQREMSLLRTIGLSSEQVRVLFIVECLAVAVLGALVGVGGSAMLCSMLFGAYTVSVMPALVAVVVTLCAAIVLSGGTKGKEFTELLRHA